MYTPVSELSESYLLISDSKFNGKHESEVKNVTPSEFGAKMGGGDENFEIS